jgi:hypothetical protein
MLIASIAVIDIEDLLQYAEELFQTTNYVFKQPDKEAFLITAVGDILQDLENLKNAVREIYLSDEVLDGSKDTIDQAFDNTAAPDDGTPEPATKVQEAPASAQKKLTENMTEIYKKELKDDAVWEAFRAKLKRHYSRTLCKVNFENAARIGKAITYLEDARRLILEKEKEEGNKQNNNE